MSKEMIELADKIEYGISTEDYYTLYPEGGKLVVAALRASAVAEPVAKTDAEHFGDILKTEAARLRAMADRFDPAPAAPAAEDTPETVATELAYFNAHAERFAGAHQGLLFAPATASVREAIERGEYTDMPPLGDSRRALASLRAPAVAPVTGNLTHVIRKGGYFYRPNAQGYTTSILEAGRWTEDEALKHADPGAGVTVRPASDFPTPEAAPTREEIIEQCALIASGTPGPREQIVLAILALKSAPAKPHHLALGSDLDDGQRGKERE